MVLWWAKVAEGCVVLWWAKVAEGCVVLWWAKVDACASGGRCSSCIEESRVDRAKGRPLANGYSAGESFVSGQVRRGKVREAKISTHLQFWCRAIRRGKLQHPRPSVPCGQAVVCNVGGPNLEQDQLIRDKTKEQGPRRMHKGAGRAPNCRKNFVEKISTPN